MELSRFKEKIFNFKVLLMGVENYLMRLNSPILKKNCMVQIIPPFFFVFLRISYENPIIIIVRYKLYDCKSYKLYDCKSYKRKLRPPHKFDLAVLT